MRNERLGWIKWLLALAMGWTSVFGSHATRTDFNGHTTTYTYDLMNCPDAARHDLQHGWHISMSAIAAKQRLTQKQADAAHPSLVYNHAPKTILYGYDDLGRRVSAESQNSGGQVLYQDAWSYDARGRTASHASSNGTLTYAYDAAGNLTQTQSDHPQGGHWSTYDYDALNRLGNVYDQNVDDGAGNVPAAAHYAYDGVGNLSAMSYSNGVRHAYTYNTLNRLTQLTVTDALSNVLHSYSHTLNAAGHKTQVVEADGRTVNYAFDQLHRLTSETIAASPGPMGVNGVASYAYDKVSNRISRTSSIAGVVNQSLAFNDNDQIDGGGYAYDDNGSTTQAPDGSADVYSFDNMLIRRVNTTEGLTVDMVYSATGNRVQKVTNGVAVNYLVDTNNHTGYAQVVEETDAAGNLEAVMVYGHDLISQDRTDGAGGFEMSFYSYDGLGSVRGLTDAIGTSLGKVHYDAYGTEIENTLSVNNPYLFAGERYDNDLGLYYLRARYLDVETGRFWSLDEFEGMKTESITLHKYLYAHGNPASYTDPSGNTVMTTQESSLVGRLQNDFMKIGLNKTIQFKIKRDVQGKIVCIAVKEIMISAVTEGIYVLATTALTPRVPYVGKSVDIERRLAEHARGATKKLASKANGLLIKFGVEVLHKADLRIIEQFILNKVMVINGAALKKGVANQVNPVNASLRKTLSKISICK